MDRSRSSRSRSAHTFVPALVGLFVLQPTNDPFVHNPNGFYVIDADGSGLAPVIVIPDFKGSPEWWRE